jgi:hypothetical protein
MSNKNNNPSLSYGRAILIRDEVPEKVVGSVLQIIETLGLTEKQEDAVKGILKKTIYDTFFTENNSIHIGDRTNTLIREKF